MTAVFQDNVVIVTGASSGIGYEVALQLADQDAWLSLVARNATRLENCRYLKPGREDGCALLERL